MTKLEVLKHYFGHSSFLEGQEELIDAVLAGQDVLGIMPTSGGKSMCYQIPALMSEGITIVVSPLISLMKDQVNALIQSGVRAAYLNRSLTPQQYETALACAERGVYKLIYVAPERLCTPSFLRFARNARLSLIAVDEAHCVSQWGQDFRPSYMRIPEFMAQLSCRPPVAAFTATATRQVREDIINLLRLDRPFIKITGFDRKNLFFSVVKPRNKFTELLSILKRFKDRSGIIYCATRNNVEEVCAKLREKGVSCGRYHAGLPDEERRSVQDDFSFDRIRVIVATNAFGMGIDKSNVNFVIHYNCPGNIESYYQEAGRAGRDGENAECILLYSKNDIGLQEYIMDMNRDNSDLDEETAAALHRRDTERLRRMEMYCNTTECLRGYILRYFGEKHSGNCGSCGNCLRGFEETDVTVEAQKILSCIVKLKLHFYPMGAAAVTDILRGSKAEKIAKFKSLSTYGIMSEVPAANIKLIINRLIQDEYVRQDSEYKTLVMTAKAEPLLHGRETLTMALPKSHKKMYQSAVSDGIYALDQGLFTRLKLMRTRLAAAAHVPAYIIFSDAALRSICQKRPADSEELLECEGIGPVKAQNYGAEILETVKNYKGSDETGGSLLESMRAAHTAGDGSMLFKLIRFNKAKLSPAEEAVSVTGFCDRILECLCISADRKLIEAALTDWLLKNNYVARTRDGKKLTATILSDEAGVTEVSKVNQKGEEYKQLIISPEGQEFLFSNTDEIFAAGSESR
ncbi:MAG: DNA helicase RecQ [Ruminococcus sp.]|nr:DNA helicase RecQ [Ruminococcus sp.]